MKHLIPVFFVAFAITAQAEVAVSIRYFKVEGMSHYHLYLYSDEGKIIRQLTSPEDAQDTAPMFSSDGQEIYFTREVHGKKRTFSIQPSGAQLHALDAEPPGYPPKTAAADQGFQSEGGGANDPLWQPRGKDLVIKTPDGKQEILLAKDDNFKESDPSFAAISFKGLTVRELASGQEQRVSTVGEEVENYCDFATRNKSPFFTAPGLSLLFYWQWQGSTDGPRLGAVDLANNHAIFLSQNPATVIPHGTRPGFFCVCEERYQPLGGSGHTVNCLYLDWWNAKLERTRFANAISLFGGASIRVRGQAQLDIGAQR